MSAAITHELQIIRTFRASRQSVWDAWTQQSALEKWISPKNFTTLFFEMEFRVGGMWRTSMQSPDGQVYTMFGNYLAIEEPNRFSFTHSWEDNAEQGHEQGYFTTVFIELEEKGDGQTTMTFRQTGFKNAGGRDGHDGGWSGAFDKLGSIVGGKQ